MRISLDPVLLTISAEYPKRASAALAKLTPAHSKNAFATTIETKNTAVLVFQNHAVLFDRLLILFFFTIDKLKFFILISDVLFYLLIF
ncbi:MAG: hypothetical protein ACD_76C00051G0001 [uncultured bacterium]|nr:MAG: hypothetical protein ACD_76C00051G0001 [uncultured bacterium]